MSAFAHLVRTALAGGLTLAVAAGMAATPASGAAPTAATPIEHVVVIFQENVSFDHYFGTYPNAANTEGPTFTAAGGTPAVAALTPTQAGVPGPLAHSSDLTSANPNGAEPKRLAAGSVNDLITCDQDHDYTAEEKAFDSGKMDLFPTGVGTASGFNFGKAASTSPPNRACQSSDVLDYYDGNTVTGLWNYAQHFAMSDNSFETEFGPSSPGALDLVSGNLGGVGQRIRTGVSSDVTSDGHGGYSLISDAQPYYDDCSSRDAVSMTGQNIGDLMNAAGLSWGFFEGGFAPTIPYSGPVTSPGSYNPLKVTGAAVCGATHNVGPAVAKAVAGSPAVDPGRTDQGAAQGPYGTKADYIAHHEPFGYYASTANPHHLAPASPAAIGTDTQTFTGGKPNFDTANHNYDMSDFDTLVSQITSGQLSPSHLPALSILKAPGYEDGHAGYSDPLDEQAFITKEINALERTPDWSSTAIVIAYDDSDGWYDHLDPASENGGQPRNPSASPADALDGKGLCGTVKTAPRLANQQGRCGFGPRLPLLVVSPWARTNAVDHNLSDQASIINFVEYNWKLPAIPGSFDAALTGTDAAAGAAFDLAGLFDFTSPHAAALFLDPATGQPLAGPTTPKSTSSDSVPAGWVVVGILALVIVIGGLVVVPRRATRT